MHTSAKLLYIAAKKVHEKLYTELLSVRKDLETETDERELADLSFALRECESLINDVRKELSKTLLKAKYMTCLRWTASQMVKQDGQPIRTSYVTATPDIKMYVPFPAKMGKEGWEEFNEYLGIPGEVYEKDLMRPNYPAMVEYCTKLVRDGKPLPPGLDPSKQQPQHDLKMRKSNTSIV